MIKIAKKLKCPICGTFNPKENTVFHSGRHYCKVCYENQQRESDDYKELIRYICELYELEVPNGWILKQIKEYKTQFNYTYRGIKSTLNYFFEIQKDHDVGDSMGIGIVPFVYDEAKKFYIEKKLSKDSIQDVDVNSVQNQKRTINIVRGTTEKNNYKNIAFIDIEKL